MYESTKQSQKPERKSRGRDESKKPSSQTGLLVGSSVAAVLIAIVISFPPLTPLLVTAPIVPTLLKKTRAADYGILTSRSLRWVLSVFLTALVASAFVPERVTGSFPFAPHLSENIQSWLTGAVSGPPASYLYIIAGMAAFAVAGVLSAGIAGCLLWSIALGSSAASAAFLYAQGHNVVQITFIAVPPWQISLFAAGLFALAPAVAVSRRTVFRKGGESFEWQSLRRYALFAAGLFVLSVVLRLTLAGTYLALARRWTII